MKANSVIAAITILLLTSSLNAVANDSADIQAHLNQAEKFADKMQLDDAIKEYSTVIYLDPKNEEAHLELGTCYKIKYSTILTEHLRNIRKNSANSGSISDLEKAMIAAEDEETKKLMASAINEWKIVIEINHSNSQAHSLLGNAYVENEQFKMAENEFKKLVELSPKDASAHAMLSVIYGKTGRLHLAIESMEKAVAIAPKTELLHVALGGLYIKAGMREQAEQEYSRLEKVGVNPLYLNQLREMMK
jgi:Flp pilus assembly protein TadD